MTGAPTPNPEPNSTIPGGGGPYRNAAFVKNGQTVRGGYKTDQQGDFALEFLQAQESSRDPFCLYMPFYAPHTPYDFQPERDRDPYAGSRFSCFPRLPMHPRQNMGLRTHQGREESMRSYSALVTGMDHNVGRVLDQLERMGSIDNTIVVFTGDQGWNAGHHGLWGKGNGTIPFNLYEESIRVPMIWSVPGRVAAGSKSDEMVSHYDFLPTLLDLLDVPLRRDRAMPGQSYRRVLEGRGSLRRDRLYFEYAYVRGQRTSRTKIVMRDGYASEFYDLQADPGESRNLWDESTGRRQAAERETEEFFRSIGAPPLNRWRETTTQKMFAYPPPV